MVKFHGLVVEEPQEDEYFLPVHRGEAGKWLNIGLFKDPEYDSEAIKDPEAIPYSSLLNRRMVRVIPIPGLSQWAQYKHHSALPTLNVIVYSEGDAALCLTGKTLELYGILEAAGEETPSLHLIESRELVHFPDGPGLRCREEILSHLKSLFGSDEIPAKLFLMYLVSAVEERKTGLVTSLLIGNFPINLVLGENGCADADHLLGLIRQLRPKVHHIEVTSSSLDKMILTPSFHAQSGSLTSGDLQLSLGTHLVLDETGLEQGQFSEKATSNLRAIMEILDHQHVSYDFGFQTVQIPADFPLLSLSSSKSIFSFPISRKITIDRTAELPSETLGLWRAYLEHCRNCKVTIPKDVAERLEAEYVELRKSKEGRGKLDENQFANVLNLAKYILNILILSHLKILGSSASPT